MLAGALGLSGCAGRQSALSGLGAEAGETLLLTIVLTVGAALVFLIVCAALWTAFSGPQAWRRKIAGVRAVTWGGIWFPVAVLSALLIYGFAVLNTVPGAAAGQDASPLRIDVDGRQWWWHVTYHHPEAGTVVSANEIRLPAGQRVQLHLTSNDVIHSFWIPAYAGKLDMIPGRTNVLTLKVDKPGTARGQCAEYCGGPHALMAFEVVTLAPADFDRWITRQAQPAPSAPAPGKDAFLQAGCGGCHTVRGTAASGEAGPDLTHVASRLSLGAGLLPPGRQSLHDWISHHQGLKPENLMPDYAFLEPAERQAIADYLSGLD